MLNRLLYLCLSVFICGCISDHPKPGEILPRLGDEIVIAGHLFHTGAPVVLWFDPGGYDSYRNEPRFALTTQPSYPAHYNRRAVNVPPENADLAFCQNTIDQFVIHYDASGLSKYCFATLHDQRGLSVHFMLDLDGTIYQTMDVKDRAWHATTSNSRSVGVEIANVGAYESPDAPAFNKWYERDASGNVQIRLPMNSGIRTPNFVAKPARSEIVSGTILNKTLYQYDFTPQQYASLAKLAAALNTALPKIELDYPRDKYGHLITGKLPDSRLTKYRGILGHYHVQSNKQDPGPAFDWDRVINTARNLRDAR